MYTAYAGEVKYVLGTLVKPHDDLGTQSNELSSADPPPSARLPSHMNASVHDLDYVCRQSTPGPTPTTTIEPSSTSTASALQQLSASPDTVSLPPETARRNFQCRAEPEPHDFSPSIAMEPPHHVARTARWRR